MRSEDAADDFTVFISYAHSDNENADASRRWLNRLLEHLQPLVLQDKVSAWSDAEIEAGEKWDGSIKSQLLDADVAVLLVSPAFLGSKYIRDSEVPALLMNAVNEGRTVIPVILRPCLFAETKFKYPDPERGPNELSLSVFQSANPPSKPLNSMEEHEQDDTLVSVARRVLDLASSKASRVSSSGGVGARGAASQFRNVEHPRNPFFTGREQILEDLNRELANAGKVALSGMGGVGKTQTAVEYAYRHKGEYGAVLWAKADGEDSLKAGLATIADRLGLPEKDETDRDKAVNAARRWLEANEGWLLILDNADDLSLVSDFLRRELRGHVLLTTRAQATGWVGKVEITEMSPEEGTLFLLRRSKLISLSDALSVATEADRAAAEEVTREVDGLPLALDQAGAFIEEMSSSPAEYLELYRREGEKLRAERGALGTDHAPVNITFSLAFKQVEESSAAAADMIRACAFLAPDAIPEEIFTSGASELGDNLASVSGGVALVKIIGEATRFSLIRRNAKTGTLDIHRLAQHVVKDEMAPDTRRLWAECVVRALNEAFPLVEYKNWSLCGKLLPHAQEASRLIDEYGIEFMEIGRVLNRAGSYCINRAQYVEAESLLLQALSIREKVLSPEDPNVATSLNDLALLYNEQGRYKEAEQLYSRALNIYEKEYGSEHPYVAISLSNLATVYERQGNYEKAEPLYVRSITILENAYGLEDPTLGRSINNLAALYNSQGKYDESGPLYIRALNIFRKGLGDEHPDTAASSNNLANTYEHQGKYEEAELLYVQALSIFEKALGPEHPTSSKVRANYNMLLEKLRARFEKK